MIMHRTLLFALTLPLAITCFDHNEDVFDESLLVHEEFLPFEDIMTGAGDNDRHFLRGRELQTSTCRALDTASVYVCGTPGMPRDSCQTSSATCDGMTYSCSCNSSGETSCSYCRAQTSNAVICHVTGSSLTFAQPGVGMITCSCEYLGNGQVRENCFQPSPRPVALPTFFPAEQTAVRTPTASLPVPLPAIPVPVPVPFVPAPTVPLPAFPQPTVPIPVSVPAVRAPTVTVVASEQETDSSSSKQKKSKK